MDNDYLLARLLQDEMDSEFSCSSTANDKQSNGKSKAIQHNSKQLYEDRTMSIVDPEWELIDPTPDIYALFAAFNNRFFWGTLHTVEVRWSPRMTSCAGVCVYQGRAGYCSVRLSRPLLILRPRKDLVETLLHEMIHAYLFVTHNNRDRDGHGPEFHRHMDRINKESGTHISVYHTFHAEVRNYQQHMWRCNGPCQTRAPFFGIVRRAMNRAPGPNDNWWAQHKATCGGKFIKSHEPEDYGKKKSKDGTDKSLTGVKDIRSFFPTGGTSSSSGASPSASINGKLLGSSNSGAVPGAVKPTGVPPQPRIVGFRDLFNNLSKDRNLYGNSVTSKNPAINNVVGFKNLQVSDKKQTSGNVLFGGKGQTLGGGLGSYKRPDADGNSFNKKPSTENHQKKPGASGSSVNKKPNTDASKKRPGAMGSSSNTKTGLNNNNKTGVAGFGGMLSNRGGGTFVLTSKTNKADINSKDSQDSLTPINKPVTSVTDVFCGQGNILGSGRGTSVGASGSSQPYSSFVNPKATSRDKGTKIKAIAGNNLVTIVEDSQKACCPVCNVHVEEDINLHLDICLTSETAVRTTSVQTKSEVIVLSDDEDNIKGSSVMVVCPVCALKVDGNAINAHLNVCVASHTGQDNNSMDVDSNMKKSEKVSCPLCKKEIFSSDLDNHLQSCAVCSLQDISSAFDEDFSEDEEEDAAVGSPCKRVSDSGEKLYPCPCCYNLIETSKMNEHLDSCLRSGAL